MSLFSGLLYKKLRLFMLLVISAFTAAGGVYLSFWVKDTEIVGILLFTFGLMGFLVSLASMYIAFKESIATRKELQFKGITEYSLEYTVNATGELAGLPILNEWKVSPANWWRFWVAQYRIQLIFFVVSISLVGLGFAVSFSIHQKIPVLISSGMMGVLLMVFLVWLNTRIYPWPFQSVNITVTTRSIGFNNDYYEFVNQRLWLTHVLLEQRKEASVLTFQSFWNDRNRKISAALRIPVPQGKLSEAVKLCSALKALYFNQETAQ